MKLIEGINPYMDDEIYHSDREFISSSGLKLMSPLANGHNPKKFHDIYVLDNAEQKYSAALEFGKYLHSLILEPDTVESKYLIFDGARRAGAKWDQCQKDAEQTGRSIITLSQKALADQLLKNYKEGKVIIGAHGYDQPATLKSFFKKGEPELTVCTELDGVKVKVRTDYFREFSDFASIQDVKTTKDYVGTKHAIEKICASFDYDLSAALYVDVVEKIVGKPTDFYFLFLSKKDGQVKLVRASEQMLEEGRTKYKAGLAALKKARETNQYFTNEVMEVNSIKL
jgi:hypothetical protein